MTEGQWLQAALGLGAILFCSGLFMVLTKRNTLIALMGIELMLNAANVNLVAFSRYYPTAGGTTFALFIMVVAAAEAAVGLALVLAVWKGSKNSNLDEVV